MNKQRGITLIALVVTIIVLIILAGISINLILGENGIITKASATKENTRGADVKETVAMRKMENVMIEHGTGTKYSKQDVIDELKEQGKLLDEEVELLKETDIITIGDIEIDFGILNENENTTEDEEIVPGITLTYDPPLNEYTNGSVVVTANTNTTGYTVKMSTDGTNWEEVNSLTYDANGKVYAKLFDEETAIDDVEGEVTNIDKIPPEVGTFKVYSDENVADVYDVELQFDEDYELYYLNYSGSDTLKVELINGNDEESGHKKTTYSIALDAAWNDDESYQDLTESIILGDDDIKFIEENSIAVSKILYNMSDYQIVPLAFDDISYYTLIVTTEDNAGNTSSRTYKITDDRDA